MSSLQPKGLLGVPLEIRLVIYDRVLSTHSVAITSDPIEPVCLDRVDGGRVGKAITQTGLNLLCVCKQIYDEASEIFYDKIKFSFHRGYPIDLNNAFEAFETFLATTHADTISKVKHLKLQLSQYPETGFESWDALALRRYGLRMRESEVLFSKLETIEICRAICNGPLFDVDQLEVCELASELFRWHPKLTQVVRLDDEALGLPSLTMRIVSEGQRVTSADPELNEVVIDIEAMIALIETNIDILVESLGVRGQAGAEGLQRETMPCPHGGGPASLNGVEVIRGRQYIHSLRDVDFTGSELAITSLHCSIEEFGSP